MTEFHCTSETPWREGIPRWPIVHHDAYEVGQQQDGWPSGDIVRMRCPHCGVTWRKELPQ